MKYSINKTNYNDFSVFEINKLEGRAYAIPYSSVETLKKTPFKKERNSSDMVKVLSGKWDFKYFASNKDLPESLDTDAIEFNKVKVPSTWQRTGYEQPAYINCPYAFEAGCGRGIFKAADGFPPERRGILQDNGQSS